MNDLYTKILKVINNNNFDEIFIILGDNTSDFLVDNMDLIIEVINYCDIDILKLFSQNTYFNPNYSNGYFFEYCIQNKLFKKSLIFLNHPEFVLEKHHSELLNLLMNYDNFTLFKNLSKKNNIDMSYGNNTLLLNSCFTKEKYFFYLLGQNSVLKHINEEWIKNWIKNTHQDKVKKALKIYNF
jgi:hypothetical protein